jgi:hydrogenase nickel incorporation protein HypA/HybF
MHELSIAMSIVEMAQEEVERQGVDVSAIHIDLGSLTGIVKEALLFSYEVACEGTILEGSRLVIREIPIEVYCNSCQGRRTLHSPQWFYCTVCGTPTPDIIHGKELAITALEIGDEPRAAHVASA